MTVYVVILCGAADRPSAELDGKTPLEAASTPTLDALARNGQQSLIRIIDERICPESDSGAMALLGYDPLRHYAGRGALEALGLGFLEAGQNAAGFRVNFASFNRRTEKLDRRTARDLEDHELQALAQEIRQGVRLERFPGVSFSLHAFGRHRGILCFMSEHEQLSGEVSNTDPGFRRIGAFGVPNEHIDHALQPCIALDSSPEARRTADLVNSFVEQAHEILGRSTVNQRRVDAGRLPANALLVRDGGSRVNPLEPFSTRHGKTLSFYGQIPAEAGLCKLVGGRFISMRWNGTDPLQAYYRAFAESVRADGADVVFAHVKEADEPGHDGEPRKKLAAIEQIDDWFLRPLVSALRPHDICVVTSDHATPCAQKIHTADCVPVVACGGSIAPDATLCFGESYARDGSLRVTRAVDLLDAVLSV
jgi:2,3-bisphosphoglycerate-independent phosphoglycerate mutase